MAGGGVFALVRRMWTRLVALRVAGSVGLTDVVALPPTLGGAASGTLGSPAGATLGSWPVRMAVSFCRIAMC